MGGRFAPEQVAGFLRNSQQIRKVYEEKEKLILESIKKEPNPDMVTHRKL